MKVFYPPIPASDGTSMNPPQNAPFTVHELTDTTYSNPLPLETEAGTNAAPLTTTAQGVLPGVYVISDNYSHNFKSGDWKWRRDSFDAAEDAIMEARAAAGVSASAAQESAQAARDAAANALAPAAEAVERAITLQGSVANTAVTTIARGAVNQAVAEKIDRSESATAISAAVAPKIDRSEAMTAISTAVAPKLNKADLPAEVSRLTADNYGWVVACFLDNLAHGEKLSLFYSPDGKTIFGGQQNPVYGNDRLRDPSIIYYKGAFYVGYTLADGVGRNFRIITSETGVAGSWTVAATVDVSGVVAPGDKCWAPELVVDGEDVYAFFTWAKSTTSETSPGSGNGSLFAMGWVKATTPTNGLKTWSAPTALATVGFSNAYIDGVPVKHGDGWYFFSSGGNQIYRAKGSSITGPYTQDRSGDWAGWGTGIEGPYLAKIGNTYRIYYDRYVAGTGHWYSESTDLNTWTTPQPVKAAPYTMPSGGRLRHGSFLQLPNMEAAAKVMAATMAPAGPGTATFTHSRSIPHDTLTDMGAASGMADPLGVIQSTDGAGGVRVSQGGAYLLTFSVVITGGVTVGANRTLINVEDGTGKELARLPMGSPEENIFSLSTVVTLPMNGLFKIVFMHRNGSAKPVAIKTTVVRLGVN